MSTNNTDIKSLKERARNYNNELKQVKEEASSLKAAVDYGQKELQRQCEYLSDLLQEDVTEDNLEEKYEKIVNKVLSDLDAGEAILARIRNKQDNGITSDEDEMKQLAGANVNMGVERTHKPENISIENKNSELPEIGGGTVLDI